MSNYTNNLFDPQVKNNSWTHVYDYVPEGGRVLDVGCSSGNFGEVLVHEKRCEVVGIDIDAPDIELARTKLSRAEVRNIEHDDVSDLGKFDIIMFIDVLEHLLDPVGALKRAQTLLKPDGCIVFSIPNMAHISIRLQLLRGFFEYTPIGILDRTHLHYYDEYEVEHIFAEAGMAIDEVNAVTKPYAKSQISEQLVGMGLAIRDADTFFGRLEETKAPVFQFVGRARPGTTETRQRPVPYLMPPEEMHRSLEARDVEVQKIGKRMEELEIQATRMEYFYHHPIRGAVMRSARKVKNIIDNK